MAIEFFIEPVPVLGHAVKKSFELSKVDVDLFGKRYDPNSPFRKKNQVLRRSLVLCRVRIFI